jgi:hypothetical protein
MAVQFKQISVCVSLVLRRFPFNLVFVQRNSLTLVVHIYMVTEQVLRHTDLALAAQTQCVTRFS